MELKNILVHVDPTERAKERINIAMTMAAPAGGHVTGIYVIPNPSLPVFMDASYVSAEMLNARHEQATENANVARKWFEQAATASGVLCEWRTEQGQAAEVVTRSARYMDVTIVGKGDRRDPEHFPYPELPADLVMSSGRPVLVVPNAGQFESVGKRVLICWNATREATRAVNDSMPILQTADKVTVLTVNPHRPEGGDHGESPGADIALQLARHGGERGIDAISSERYIHCRHHPCAGQRSRC